jgi:glutamine phosphoribosylpyrophosphate amidotransferase
LTPAEAQRVASSLLFFGRDRGDQSAGIWFEGMGQPLKRALAVDEFISTKSYNAIFDRVKEKGRFVLLTHTRYPTCGGRTDADAQPFKAGDTVTIHNGMIINPGQLEKKFNFVRKTQVDSEVFARYINRHGVRNLPKFMHLLSGNAAVVAYKAGKVYAFRSGNPLVVASIPGDGVIWASTKQQVEAAMVTVWGFLPECTITEIASNTIYSFKEDGEVIKLASFNTAPVRQYSFNCKYDDDESTNMRTLANGRIVRMGSEDPDVPWQMWLTGEVDERTISVEEPVKDAD